MDLIIIGSGLAIGGILLAVYRRRRRSSSGGANRNEGPPSGEGLPAIFRVVAVGLSGAGKTIFLTSLFHELYLLRKDKRSYYMDANEADAKILHRQWERLVKGASWPRTTYAGESKAYLFNFVVKGDAGAHTVLQMEYLDYPGEVFSGSDDLLDDDASMVAHHIHSAHAIFCILDGERIAQLLTGDPRGVEYMWGTLPSVISPVLRGRCPVHFLITKWDLIESLEASRSTEAALGQVRAALLRFHDFTDLVRSLAENQRRVRLIPVSAVGPDFARLDENDGMVKVAGAHVAPMNLDVPLSVVVPDYFEQVEQQMPESDRRRIRSEWASGSRSTLAETTEHIATVLSAAARGALKGAFGLSLGANVVIDSLTALFFRWVAQHGEGNATDADDPEIQRDPRHLARDAILGDFQKVAWELDLHTPSSKLV